jgi:hypothetical protein
MATGVDYIRASNGQAPFVSGELADAATQDFLDNEASRDDQRYEDYQMYEEFYRGDHKTKLTDRARQYLEGHGHHVKFRDNFAETVIDIIAERLEIVGFTAGEDDVISTWLQEFWDQERMDTEQTTIHTTALMKADCFVMVDWEEPDEDEDEGHACIVFNDPSLVKVKYEASSTKEMERASKCWADSMEIGEHTYLEIERLNIYYPGYIEKWWRARSDGSKTGKGGWMKWETVGEEWPLPWVDEKGKNLGIPVFHFRNRSLGKTHGFSDLENTIPSIESLNKLVIDLNAIADSQAWDQRWGTGISVNEAADYKNVPGEMWVHPNEGAKFGQFDAASLEGIIAAIENVLSRLARRTRSPMHLLTGGDMPSGESLRAAEAGLVAKVLDRSKTYGNTWEDIMLFVLRLTQSRQGLKFEVPRNLKVMWKDPQSRNELEALNVALLKKQIGVSNRTLLIEQGYDPDQEEKQSTEEKEAALEQQAKMFDAGNLGGFGGGQDLPKDKNKKDKAKPDDKGAK